MDKYSLADNLPPSELVTLSGLRPYLARAGRAPFEVHQHSFNQIIWFRAGTGVHLVDFVEHSYGPQTLVYVPHGAVHAFRKDEALDGVLIHFDDVMAMGSSDGQSLPGILQSLAMSSRTGDSFEEPRQHVPVEGEARTHPVKVRRTRKARETAA